MWQEIKKKVTIPQPSAETVNTLYDQIMEDLRFGPCLNPPSDPYNPHTTNVLNFLREVTFPKYYRIKKASSPEITRHRILLPGFNKCDITVELERRSGDQFISITAKKNPLSDETSEEVTSYSYGFTVRKHSEVYVDSLKDGYLTIVEVEAEPPTPKSEKIVLKW